MSTDRELTGHSEMRNWIFMQSPRTALQNVCLLQREKSKFPLGEPGSNQSEHQAGWGKLPSCPLEGDSERNTVILCVIMWHPWPRRTASNYKEPSAKPNLKEVLKKKKKKGLVCKVPKCQINVMKVKGRLRKYSRLKETKETRKFNMICDSRIGFFCSKWYYWNNGRNPKRVNEWDGGNTSLLVTWVWRLHCGSGE